MPDPVFLDTPIALPGQVFALSDALQRDEPWFNQALAGVNDSVLRVAKLHGEFHHHSHTTDELFYVLEGHMQIDIDGVLHDLAQGSGVVVPAGVTHRTRADAPATVLLVAARDSDMGGHR